MDRQKDYIVFQCYGHERVFHECAYALLSLSRLYGPGKLSNTEIWIYTDNPVWFGSFKDCSLPLKYKAIDNNTIKQWSGKIDFVHRVKIEILKDFTSHEKGNILYLDTDVVFTHSIDKMMKDINEGKLYMHIMEGIISEEGNAVLRKLNKYLQQDGKRELNEKPLQSMAMWNAGVLGFNTKHTGLLDEVLAFTDNEYPKFPKHIIEQFAFSVFFQLKDTVKAAAPYIFHYWNLKEAGLVLSSFFSHFKDKSWEELTRLSSLVQIHTLMQEKANFFRNRGLAGSVLNKYWIPAKPNWEELQKQL
ncbi:MAG: glycosyltransferase [Chitinophagales bacterium]